MTAIDHSTVPGFAGRYSLPLDMLQRSFVWLLVAVSWCVFIEPSPYEFVFAITFLLFLPHGMSAGRTLVPLVIFLLLYNAGGVLSMVPRMDSPDAVRFTAVSCYMAITGLFFAFACAKAPLKIIPVVRHAYIFAAVIASIIGMIGYFDIAGMAELWAPIGRAQGTFKDPNVFSTYLILPAVFLVHALITGQQQWKPIAIAALFVILAGNFLAFSRGAWLAMLMSIVTAMALTFMVTPSLKLRSRIVLWSIAGGIVVVGLLVFALSFHEVSAMFSERAKLVQVYDAGEMGRFARQINSIPVLLQAPNGIGVVEFAIMFGEDPHNVYLNAFTAYGWLGGLSYLLLTIATVIAGWRAVFARTPWQHYSIVIVSVMFIAILQGVQIDTDHWRHFYLQLGLVWGLFAATEAYIGRRQHPHTRPRAPVPATTPARSEKPAPAETQAPTLLNHNSPVRLRRTIVMQTAE